MEIHKNIVITPKKYDFSHLDTHYEYFQIAYRFVNDYYKEDLDRIWNTDFNEITTKEFFREYTWCVYTSGFNARVVSKMFPALREVYEPLDGVFSDLKVSGINSIDIVNQALMICNNKRKVKAILDTAFIGGQEIKKSGWSIYKNTKLNSPDKLKELPFIGPITCFHLARNIGLLNFVKPDLHMNRLATRWHFENPVELCKSIQKEFNIPLGIVDLVLWYAASTFGTNEKSSSNR